MAEWLCPFWSPSVGKRHPIYKGRILSPRRAVTQVIGILHRAGHEALLAGGCVRDMLLGQTPHDYDVATNATPETITTLFPNTITVGAQFGVVVVLFGGRQIEVATFRSDGQYHDGRRPSDVVFTDVRNDAIRRDFTINGMFYDLPQQRVVDYVGGQKDLQKKVIRAIGDPVDRFAEDHLRMLRAIRFACRLEFEIEPKTYQAICRHAARIERVSPERIMMEMEKILVDARRGRGLRLAFDAKLLECVFPKLPAPMLIAGMDVLEQLPQRCSFALALAALLIDAGGKQAGNLCRHLKASNDLRRQVQWLVEHQRSLLEAGPLTRGRLKKWLAEPLFDPLMQLCRCYLKATAQSLSPLHRLRRQIRELGDDPIIPPRLLDGHDLIRLGAQPGPTVGQLAEDLYMAQLENHVRTKPQAQTWASQWLDHHRRRDDA